MKAVNEILKTRFSYCLRVVFFRKICNCSLFLVLFFGFAIKVVSQSTDYTSNGSYTVPAGVTSIVVECWGGGGAGGGNPYNDYGSGGGGGGAYVRSTIIVVPGTTYEVVVGSGGTGSTGNGTNGGDSRFGNPALALAKGGSGGQGSNGSSGSQGGLGGLASGSSGDIALSGGNGGRGRNSTTGQGGPGGSSAGIGGEGISGSDPFTTMVAGSPPTGGGRGGNGGDSNQDGFSGTSPGGGGGGSGDRNQVGGNGANGLVRITCASRVFTSSDSFVIPSGVTSVTVEAWGGGGAGGAATGNPAAGGGGAGGAFAKGKIDVVPGSTHTVTVGAGGTGGGGAGQAGSGSFFSSASTLFAQGGAGGALASANSSNGAGGIGSSGASIGDPVFKGGDGASGLFTTYGGAGGSGAGSSGVGNNASGQTGGAYKFYNGGAGANGPTGSAAGTNGSSFGGGGSGGRAGTNTNRNGGSGGSGCVIISWEEPSFYYDGSGNLSDPANWKTLEDNPAANFTDNFQTFIIESGIEGVTSGTGWTVSGTNTKVIIRGILTETQGSPVSLSSNTMLVIDDGGVLNHYNNSITVFGGVRIFSGSSTVNFGMDGNQTVIDANYGNLTLSGSGTKTITNSIVNGVLSMEGTATVSAPVNYGSNATLQYKGTLAQATGQELPTLFSGSGGIIFDNAAGVTISGNCTVSSSITMQQGNVFTGAFILKLSNSSSSSLIRNTGTIIGNFSRSVSNTGVNYLFPVGTIDYYRGAALNFSALTATDITATFNESSPGAFTSYTDGNELKHIFSEGFWSFSNSTAISGTCSVTLLADGFLSYFFDETARMTGRTNNNTTWRSMGSHNSVAGIEISRNTVSLNNTSFDFGIATCNIRVTSGYSYERTITIDHTKVEGSSDLFNFPIMISFSAEDFLRTKVSNSNGWDIAFTDLDDNKLDHQLEYYNGTNGDLIAWVRIPTLSTSSNTVIKMVYGDPAIAADPSVTSVWDSHYKGVWHFDNSGLTDFTSFGKNATPYNTPTNPSGKISNALGLNGSDEYAVVESAPNINFNGNITVSAWVNMSAGGRDQKIAGNQNGASGGFKFGIYTNNKVEFEIRNSSDQPSLNRDVTGGTVLSTGQWYYLAGMSSDILDSIKTFVNGIPERPFKKTGILGIASDNLSIGKEPFASLYYFQGMFDELRISDKVRSDGWLRTEYLNQNSPSDFYSLGSEIASGYLPSRGICDGPMALSFGYPTGGTYSGTDVSGNIFTPQNSGTYTITYTVTADCKNISVSKYIVVTPKPDAPVAPNMAFCSDQIPYLQATGTNIKWYKNGVLVSTANPYSPEGLTVGTHNYTVSQSVNGCESDPVAVSLTISNEAIAIQPVAVTICNGENATFTIGSAGYGPAFQWYENGNPITGATSSTLVLTNPGLVKSGNIYTCIVTSTCGTSETSDDALLTVTPVPVATFSYQSATYCINASNPSPVFNGGGVAGVFSSDPGTGLDLNSSTGVINLLNSVPGEYTVVNTIVASGGCSEVVDSNPVSIIATSDWIGGSSDWNAGSNWSCGIPPTSVIDATVTIDSPNPEIAPGNEGSVRNLIINSGSTLNVSGKLRISGSITNNGTLNAANGTIEMNGSSAQILGNVFEANTIKNLTINNTSNVSITAPLSITGAIDLQNGNLASDDNLTLVSSSSGTAFVYGSVYNITGNVTMQRYLDNAYGYSYFSSPFTSAKVSEFVPEITLGGSFALIYKYDENRLYSGVPVSGWERYDVAENTLFPLNGYSLNFAVNTPLTVDVTGILNNGPLQLSVYNHNQKYTIGYNFVGNPYPSAIDWDLVSDLNPDLENAIYIFEATDRYTGVYSSYVNGVSTGKGSNIIPSMQGFFIHVPDPVAPDVYPVTATLNIDNSVRITDTNHEFLKKSSSEYTKKGSRVSAEMKSKGEIPLLKISAGFSDNSLSDPAVIYFDEKASGKFDKNLDARKFLNTSQVLPNFYSYSTDNAMVSINAIPFEQEHLPEIPLGIRTKRNGTVVFRIQDIQGPFPVSTIYLYDAYEGTLQDITSTDQRVFLNSGNYDNRFFLRFENLTTDLRNDISLKPLNLYSSGSIIHAEVNCLEGSPGILRLINLTGQVLLERKIYENGHHEFDANLKSGIYVISFESRLFRKSQKIFIK